MPSRKLLLIFTLLSALSAYLLAPPTMRLFQSLGHVQANFQGKKIPQGVGILFVAASGPWYLLYLAVGPLSRLDRLTLSALFSAVFALGLLGLADDFFGSASARGLKGHLKALLRGRITTGIIKAAGGLALAWLISGFYYSTRAEVVVNTLVLALFTNLLNLLDLRPGRALKFYLTVAALVILGTITKDRPQPALFLLPFTGAAAGFLPFDLKARAMMGDAGANMLGLSAGILVTGLLNLKGKFITLILLTILHIIADTYSLSRLISHSRTLTLVDNLGRQE
jgi:UDP-GlcNAc:undecaprenyl-phosphate GlcNAc-1-phosphate transferase